YRTATQMARTNGPRRPLAGSGSGEADPWRVTAGAAVTDGPSQTDPRFRPLNSDLDREAASPSVALWQRGFVSPKLPAAAAAQSPQQKTRRGVPPGHGRILLDRAFSIRDSGNRSQGQKALDPAALMTARRTIEQPHSAVHPPLFDSRSP